jgi:hypothetical protein
LNARGGHNFQGGHRFGKGSTFTPTRVQDLPIDAAQLKSKEGWILTLPLCSSFDRLFIEDFRGFPDFKDSANMNPPKSDKSKLCGQPNIASVAF